MIIKIEGEEPLKTSVKQGKPCLEILFLIESNFKLLSGPKKRLLGAEELEKGWAICLFQFWKELSVRFALHFEAN